MFVMPTVPLQGCWETYSLSSPAASPDSEFLSSLSLATSASRAERFSPETDQKKKITSISTENYSYYCFEYNYSGFGTTGVDVISVK